MTSKPTAEQVAALREALKDYTNVYDGMPGYRLIVIEAKAEKALADSEGLVDKIKKYEEALTAIANLFHEIDCRIEHGAESGGHLEYVHKKLKEMLK